MRSVVFVAPLRGAAAFVFALFSFAPAGPARAQDDSGQSLQTLPVIDVISSRIGTTTRKSSGASRSSANAPIVSDGNAVTSEGEIVAGGIAGASTTIITAAEIERAPQSTLQDILSREAGIQTSSIYGGVNGTGTSVDMRGFGVTAPSNVLVLVDGRRFNDSDLPGFDFSLIPRNAIERIEITRGGSGAVLYGDGAMGGVINIVTKSGAGAAPNARVEGSFGTFNTYESKVSVSSSYNGASAAAFGNVFRSDGYREHNETRQAQGVGDLRYTTRDGSIFFNISGDNLRQNLPGPRNILNGPFVGFVDQYLTDRRGTNTPMDFANRQNMALRGGVSRNLWAGAELTLDGGFRQKQTQAGFFAPYNTLFVVPNTPTAYTVTELSTASLTPRLNVDQTFDWVRMRMIAGIDVYKTTYQSDRAVFQGATPHHVYDISQLTTAGYLQPTFTLWKNTDIAIGGRVQRNTLSARDTFNPNAPQPGFPIPQGLPLDSAETRHATHVGIEHRFNQTFAVFGRMAQSFRLPNVDERVGMAPLGGTTNFSLRTQRSHDYEGGVRLHAGPFDLQTSAYRMYLADELHLNPLTFANVNLPPTLRYGVENTLTYKATEALRLKMAASYTRAVFRVGPFAGNDVPQVARHTAFAGFSWDIYRKYLTFDGGVRYAGKRFLDGDEANVGRMMVPAAAVVDVRLGGEYQNCFWAVNVQNLFDRQYFDYGLDNSFPGNFFVSLYPLPGRTIQFRLGARFG